jgi:hypothetical protein
MREVRRQRESVEQRKAPFKDRHVAVGESTGDVSVELVDHRDRCRVHIARFSMQANLVVAPQRTGTLSKWVARSGMAQLAMA